MSCCCCTPPPAALTLRALPATQTVTDQLVGTVFVTAAMVVFAYYTTWVVVTVRVERMLADDESHCLEACGSGRGVGAWMRARRVWRCAHPRASPPPPRQPLLGPKHFLQPFFLDRKLALVIPAAILAGVVAFAGLFIGYTLLKAGSKPAPSPVAAAAEGAAEGAAAGAKKAKATKRK